VTNDPYAELELWLGPAVMVAVPLYFLLQAWSAYGWRGGWRTAALLPLIPIVPSILWSLYALSQGSNLWPITVILLAPFCCAYLLVLCAVRLVARRFSTAGVISPKGG